MEILQAKTADLIPYGFNNRDHSQQQIDRIANSINEFGFNQPIVVDEQNIVLVGHGRLEAAKKLGLEDVPVLKKIGLSETQKKAYRILDNKLQNDSTWNTESLEIELAALEEADFNLSAFGLDDLLKLFPAKNEIQDDGFEVTETPETIIRVGDLIELGQHRLLCCDSTEEESWGRLMSTHKAGVLFTSPPYAKQRTYTGEGELSPSHLAKFIRHCSQYTNVMCVNLGLAREDGFLNCYWDNYIQAASESGLGILSWNVWYRTDGFSVGQITAMFPIQHEFIFVFGRRPEKLNPTIANKHAGTSVLPTVRSADGTISDSRETGIRSHRELGTVIEIPAVRQSINHPAQFPVDLAGEYIKAFNGDIIEPFAGSGTTLIAADQLGRRCFAMEISPKYCQVIVDRYKALCEKAGKPFVCKLNGEDVSAYIRTTDQLADADKVIGT